ncbi:hypothetical protein GcM3_218045 [Golovinomyces cichoracearum]|uniref:Uncharacterized protein n=1 Tax=Golovinomyces cichoracearum TaxID=62708 RepID=A0A420H7W6_9PEZI|nr:hypothetical protein GcM3_218045 [Golovinomyces cichoracearum]
MDGRGASSNQRAKEIQKFSKANCPGNSSLDEIKENLSKEKLMKKDSTEDWSYHAIQQILNEEKVFLKAIKEHRNYSSVCFRTNKTNKDNLERENLLTLFQQLATVENSLSLPVMMQETFQTT